MYLPLFECLQAPVSSINEVLKMSEALTLLATYNVSAEADPLLAKFTTTICKKMVDKSWELLQDEKYPHKMSEKSHKLSRLLFSFAFIRVYLVFVFFFCLAP
jgi:hypothetical protein